MRVELISDPSKLRRLAEEWDDLSVSAAEPNPFFERWILEPAIEHLGRSAVTLLTVRRGSDPSRLLGLLPLVRKSGYRHIPISYTTIWKHLHCYLCTPLVRAGEEQDFLRAVFEWMKRRGEYVMELPVISGDGPFARALEARILEDGMAFDRTDSYERAVFTSQADPESYTNEVVHGRHKKDLKRKSRLLEEIGPVKARTILAGEISDWCERFLKLEDSGWKGSAGTALARNPADRAFFEEIVRRGAETDRLIMRLLTVGGQDAAMLVALRSPPGAFMLKVAYEERFSKGSPGLHLEIDNIRYFSREAGVMWVDSCTAPNNDMYNRLWRDRRHVVTTMVGTGSKVGAGVINMAKKLAAGIRALKGDSPGQHA